MMNLNNMSSQSHQHVLRVITSRSILITLSLLFLIVLQSTTFSEGMIIPKPSFIANDIMAGIDVSQHGLFDQVTDDYVIQFKVPDSAFDLKGNPSKENLRYRVFAYPSDTPVEMLDSIDGFPVFASFLYNNDFKFKLMPNSGISMNDPYVVFMTRVPDFRQVTFLFQVDDDVNGNFIGNTIFSFSRTRATQDMVKVPVKSSSGSNIGSFLVDYVIVSPISNEKDLQNLSGNGAEKFKNMSHHRVVHSGHRGLGAGVRNDIPGYDELQENTVASFNYAGSHGADMVELDVSLTRDQKVVVYHDLVLDDTQTGKRVAIRDLFYEELQTHRYQPIVRDVVRDPSNSQKVLKLRSKNVADPDTTVFELLRTVLQRVNPKTAINIEIKYPNPLKDKPGQWYPCQPFDLNEYLDIILAELCFFVGDREIMFSSFEPDVCSALKLKQRKYPVFLLTRNGGYDPPTSDEKRNNIELGINFAAAMQLSGVNSYGEYILRKGPSFVDFMHKNLDLIVYCWEGPLTVQQLDTLIIMDVDGLCYDKIDLKKSKVKDSDRRMTLKRRESVIVLNKKKRTDSVILQNVVNLSRTASFARSIWSTAMMAMTAFV